MFIEVYHKGKFSNRVYIHIPENNTGFKQDQLSFKERSEEKEATVKLVIKDFIANTLPSMFRNANDIQLAVVFESKMNIQPVIKLQAPPLAEGEIIPTKKIIMPAEKKERIEIENKPFVRPKAEYSNPQIPTELLAERQAGRVTQIGIIPIKVNRGRPHRAMIKNEF